MLSKDNIALSISWWALKCDMIYLAWTFSQAYISNMDILRSVLARFGTNCLKTQYHVCASKIFLCGKHLGEAFSQSNPFRRIDKMQTGSTAPNIQNWQFSYIAPPPKPSWVVQNSSKSNLRMDAKAACFELDAKSEERNSQSYGKLIPGLLSSLSSSGSRELSRSYDNKHLAARELETWNYF